MSTSLSEEQQKLVELSRQVGSRFGLDYWRDIDARQEFPHACWQAICDAGLAGIAMPEEFGGSALGMMDFALAVEALCASGGGATLSQVFMVNSIFGGIALARMGSEEMKREYLPKLIDGSMTFCMALTEPDAGTNSLMVKTFARANGRGWLLNGQKIWITAVPQAKKMLVICRTMRPEDVRRKTDGITLFMIDTDRPGLEHRAIDKLGTNTLPASTVFFQDVEVYPEEVIGELDRGWIALLEVLNTERIVTTAGLLGTTELALDIAVKYANERKVFDGKPISSYQGIQFPLSEAYIQAQCAKLMNFKAASLCDQRLPYGSEANMAKWMAARAATTATDRAIQTLGGMGYARDYHVERLWRDTRLFRLAPISEEMGLNYVAQHNLGLARAY
jgi:acyl-CoA dehydrogenase